MRLNQFGEGSHWTKQVPKSPHNHNHAKIVATDLVVGRAAGLVAGKR